jgi:6-phosphogluconolactonase (cycloisomerase 2 family)
MPAKMTRSGVGLRLTPRYSRPGGTERRLVLLLWSIAAGTLYSCGSESSPPPVTPPATLKSIAVTPTGTTIAAGATQQFAAAGAFSDGSMADITSTVTWTSSDTTSASISSSGLAKAAAPGRPSIMASSGGISGSASLIIVNGVSSGVARFAYVTSDDLDPSTPSFGSGTISTFTVNSATGQLRQVSYVLAGPAPPGPIIVDPQNRFAYVANSSFATPPGENTISVFSIDPGNGRLTAIPGSPFATGEASLGNLVIDPRGKFLYTESASGHVLIFQINPTTGALTPIAGPPGTGASLNLIAVDPSGAFVYATGSLGQLFGFKIDSSSGALTAVPNSPFLAEGSGMSIDPTGHFLYVADGDIIYAFAIDSSTGALTKLPTDPNATSTPASTGVTLDPTGKFLYVAHETFSATSSDYISMFKIDSNGGVTQPASQFPTSEVIPVSLQFDPAGKFLYVTEAETSVETFSVSASGALSPAASAQTRSSAGITLSNGQAAISYTPTFAYVADAASNDVTAYSINASSGALTSGGTVAAASPSAIAIDPFGKFAYVARGGDNSVAAYSISGTTGALNSLGSVATGSSPASLAVDPSARFVYVANKASNDISMYAVSPVTGTLTSMGSVGSGTTPIALAIDPTGQFVLVANQGSSDVWAYSIDVSTGVLASDGVLDPGTNPTLPPSDSSGRTSVAVDPSGKLAYVGGRSGLISIYESGPAVAIPFFKANGTLSAGTSAVIVATEPSGRFAYAAETNFNIVHMYAINQTNGTLTPTGTVATGQSPVTISAEPSGKFAYVVNKGSNNISIYTIDPATGALVSAGTVTTGSQPVAIVTTATIQ